MVPSVADIIRYRYITRLALRLVGLTLILFSLAPLIAWTVEGILDFDWDLFYYGYYFTRMCSIAWMFVVGLGLILLAKPLAKAFNPLPRNECPQCGYHLRDLTRRVCPECGLQLPAELLVNERQPLFMDDSTPPPPPAPPAGP